MDAHEEDEGAASNVGVNVNVTSEQVVRQKRVVKLTQKAFAERLERLQNERKCMLNKAAKIRKGIQDLLNNEGNVSVVQKCFDEFINVCDDAKSIHCTLSDMLPDHEREKHEVWFKAKMMFNDEFILEVKGWLQEPEKLPTFDFNEVKCNNVRPEDSISNASSKQSKRSSCSSTSARIKAEADRAAVLAEARVLKERHALEEQEQKIKQRKEQLELEAKLAASEAKLAVFQASENGSMVSNTKKSSVEKKQKLTLDPKAKEYKPLKHSRFLTPHWQLQSETPTIHNANLIKNAKHTDVDQNEGDMQLHSRFNRQQIHQRQGHIQQVDQRQGDICSILARQNEITAALVQQQRLLSLPPRDIPIFNGDPLQYMSFRRAFEQGVEAKASKSDCLYYLEQFTVGQPRDLVRSCHHMEPERGYLKAMQLLQEHFGNEFRIVTAYMEKALAWNPIKSEDVKALQSYTLFLRGCCNIMGELHYMSEMNMPSNMRIILSKIPYKLRERWRSVAFDIFETTDQRASFNDLVEFLERHVKMLSDPLFRDIQETQAMTSAMRGSNTRPRQQTGSTIRNNTFATAVAPLQNQDRSTTEVLTDVACVICSQRHAVEECPTVHGKTHKEKIEMLQERGLCFGCLKAGHVRRNCESRSSCKICGFLHHTLLHVERRPERNSNQQEELANTQTCGHTGAGKDHCYLSILPVQIKAERGSEIINTYALLDPGSTASFCSEELMKRLKVSGRKTQFLLQTMGQERVVPAYCVKGLEVSGLDKNCFYQLPEVLTQKRMPVNKDCIVSDKELAKWTYLEHVNIPNIEANVDLLIGSNAPKVLEPWEVINSQGNGPYAIRTVLGWVINGPLDGDACSDQSSPSAVVNRISAYKLEELLHKQYEHDFNERATEEKGPSREDLRFMEILEQSAAIEDGHYSLKLPLKSEVVHLPNNLSVAKQRLNNLKRKFVRNKQFCMEYTAKMNEMIDEGYAEQITFHDEEVDTGKIWYIPHHGVYHPRKKSLRVVFDCGATFKGTSLNQNLLQGPNLASTLCGVLLRFRKESVAFMGDVKSMFHQVKVTKCNRDFLRFLWWPGGDLSKEAAVFRMTVHLFGAVSSPSCASFALRKTADDHQADFPAEVIQVVKENFYVDDCLSSLANEEAALTMVQQLTALCQRGGFSLTRWVSNSEYMTKMLSETKDIEVLKEMDLDQEVPLMERALGLQWCVRTDTFMFKMEIPQRPCTRRGMLSISSSVYDPMGFLAPAVLPSKIMLQELCRRNIGWDDIVPQDIKHQWERWLEGLDMLSVFKVERCIKPKGFGVPQYAQLHHFSDASEVGYGTVTYLRLQGIKGDVHVSFLMGKARVTPIKAVTIPRLELTAAVLSVRMDLMLKSEMKMQLQESVFWTDSTSVLRYIKNEDKRFHTFVSNRISVIRDATTFSQWRYIGSKENPADAASRGMKITEFIEGKRWIRGPEFLSRKQEEWPINVVDIEETYDPEIKGEVAVYAVNTINGLDATSCLLTYFSDWRKLKVAVAWILRLKRLLLERIKDVSTNINQGQGQTVQPLSGEELFQAERAIIQFAQHQEFAEEIAALSVGKDVKRHSTVYKLAPRLDNGLMRVGGRLTRGCLPEEAKHPLILSKRQPVASLIIKNIHLQLGHSGRNHTLSTLRRKYWVTNATSAVRQIIRECCFCRKYNAKTKDQKMADLPRERILPDYPPFTNVGVDYFGPIEVKRGRTVIKRYGVIFTCLACRAVHLEVASSLDTDSCINTLRRFLCRRGQVSSIFSDNGTNFIGAEKELKEAVSSLNHAKIHQALQERGVKWNFNPPAAPHHGGIWERLIRMIKKILRSVLLQQALDEDGLNTLMCEAEAILNDRPITKLSDDPTDLEALTPKPPLPPGLFVQKDLYVKRRWRQVQYLADLFWKRWVREYLPLLQERQQWNERKKNLKPGDVVIIMDPSAPRCSWPLGRVLKVLADKDGLVRSVQLQTKTSIIERPITKLCLLLEDE